MCAAETAQRLAAKVRGCHAFDFQKPAVEIGGAVETNFKTNVVDLLLGIHQQLAGPADAHSVDEIGEGIASGFAKKPAEPAFAHAQFSGKRGGRVVVRQLFGDAVDNAVDQIQRCIIVIDLQLRAGEQTVIGTRRQISQEFTKSIEAAQALRGLDDQT